jgi:hypothetical protein
MRVLLMSNNNSRVSLAEEIAKRWNEASIPYAVVHGLENFPRKIGRDIDLVMRKTDVSDAVKCAMAVGLEHGFSRGFFRWSYWGLYQLILIHDDNETSLPIDIICKTMNWNAKWISFVDEDKLDRFICSDSRRGHFLVSEEGTFYKECVKPLLCGDLRRFGREISLPAEIPKIVSHKHLKGILGAFGMSLLESANIKDLETEYSKATRRLQWQWVRSHPLKAIVNLLSTLHRRAMINLFTSSNIILFRTTEPEVLTNCLHKLAQPLKQLFIDLRPINAKYGSISTIWGSLIGWRHRPVSEFILCAVVENMPQNDGGEVFSKVKLRLGRGRIGLGPDAIITVPSGIEAEDLYVQLREQIITLMGTLYPLPKDALGLMGRGEGK